MTSSALKLALVQSAPVFIVAALLQQRWGTIVDTSWLITESERMLSGERLYVDVIDNNPPFSLWLFLPGILFSNWTGIAPEIGVYLYTCLAVVIGVGVAAMIVHKAAFPENERLIRLLPLFVAIFMIFPGIAFTERDQLGAVLLLPLLAMMAWRAGGARRVAPALALIVAAACCGSVLVLVKPYYMVAYIAPALYVAWRQKSLWPLVAPENCLIGLIGVIYIGLVAWLTPEFIHDILPEVVDVYMGSGNSLAVALGYAPLYLLLLGLVWIVAPRVPLTPLAAVALLASIAATIPLVYQGKGWAYHAFPAISLALVVVLCRIAASPDWRSGRHILGRAACCAVAVAIVWLPFSDTQKPAAAFVAAVKAAAPDNPTLGVIGSDIAAAHPLTRMVGARFPSANNSDWFGALAYVMQLQAAQKGATVDAARYQKTSDNYLDEKYAEFAKYNYDLIVVQQDEPLWTDHVLGQPRFATVLSGYRPVAKDERFVVYGRARSSGS